MVSLCRTKKGKVIPEDGPKSIVIMDTKMYLKTTKGSPNSELIEETKAVNEDPHRTHLTLEKKPKVILFYGNPKPHIARIVKVALQELEGKRRTYNRLYAKIQFSKTLC